MNFTKIKRVYSPGDVAEIMGVSTLTVYGWIHRAEDPLPAKRVSGRYYITDDALENWLHDVR